MADTQYSQVSQNEFERYESGRKRHFRRCANELDKDFKCPFPPCSKIYGSEGSLNLHMKLKHNAGSKTDREKLAKTIVMKINSGMSWEKFEDINLPPGELEKAAQTLGIKLPNKESVLLEKLAGGKSGHDKGMSGDRKKKRNLKGCILYGDENKNVLNLIE